jgi:hypothetical protein
MHFPSVVTLRFQTGEDRLSTRNDKATLKFLTYGSGLSIAKELLTTAQLYQQEVKTVSVVDCLQVAPYAHLAWPLEIIPAKALVGVLGFESDRTAMEFGSRRSYSFFLCHIPA